MKKKLLIVDDEPSIRLILEHYFAKTYDVVVKINGHEAFEWLQAGNLVDAIVADYNMPVLNGFEFIKKIRANDLYKNVPLVMLSGKDETKSKIECLRNGADDYLVKPFNPEELGLRIQNILSRIK